jgi:hypothetical protein
VLGLAEREAVSTPTPELNTMCTVVAVPFTVTVDALGEDEYPTTDPIL